MTARTACNIDGLLEAVREAADRSKGPDNYIHVIIGFDITPIEHHSLRELMKELEETHDIGTHRYSGNPHFDVMVSRRLRIAG